VRPIPSKPAPRVVPLERRWNHNFHYHDLVLAAMPAPCRTALDVGCGEGTLLAKLAARAERVTGIDASPLALARVRATAPTAEWIEADFLAHDFGARRFDFVACVATLHHMEFAPAVGKMKALLEPGGVLAVVGLANSVTAKDVAYDAMGLAQSRLERARRGFYRAEAPQAVARMTYGQVEREAERLLPGAAFRRLVLFRYLVTWVKPVPTGA
jgi:2-polyprenyl-3-methyl-5-hydroxy-6-metoxy-1,4-benzoquinol methylase